MKNNRSDEKVDGDAIINEKIESGLLRAVITHFVHLDRIMWSRVQWLAAVQAGAIAGAYATHTEKLQLSLGSLLLSLILTVILFFMMERDAQIRDSNKDLIENLAKDLHPYKNTKISAFQLDPIPTCRSGCLRGRAWNRIAFVIFFIIDLIGIILICLDN